MIPSPSTETISTISASGGNAGRKGGGAPAGQARCAVPDSPAPPRARRWRRDIPEAVVDALARAYTGGESLMDMEERTGLPMNTIRRRLLERGVEMRGKAGGYRERKPVSLDTLDAVAAQWRAGKTLHHIARSLGIGLRKVGELAKIRGLEPRKRGGWSIRRGGK